MSRRQALGRTLAMPSLRRSLIVALVVGSVLNAINQGTEFANGERLILWKAALTFIVPFLVASYGSYAALRSGR